MSSPNRSTSDIEDAFSSMNILNYTSVSSDYFPASSGSISFNSSEDSNIIPSIFEIGKSSSKIHLKHHENQIEDILNYLEDLSFYRIGEWKKITSKGLTEKVRFSYYQTSKEAFRAKELKIDFVSIGISQILNNHEGTKLVHQTGSGGSFRMASTAHNN
ncbi:hypothetical protein Tco_1570034 [Tanacetum coccineum]